jgi:5'-nucleotidase
MKILLSNDDGIFADGLWWLARTLTNIGKVVIAAPDREQSATGTQVTLRIPLRVRKLDCFDATIDTFAVEGSHSDSVILALGKLAPDASIVVSGINQGLNLGDDVLISGTVGAALQGYLRGLPALAISVPAESSVATFQIAARLASLVSTIIKAGDLGDNPFFNINVPNLPLGKIRGIKSACLAHKTHIDTVSEGHDGRREYYWLVRQQLSHDVDPDTDIWAFDNGFITVTALHSCLFNRSDGEVTSTLCGSLFDRLCQS